MNKNNVKSLQGLTLTDKALPRDFKLADTWNYPPPPQLSMCMKMRGIQVVYVLISDESDFYSEECFISIYSLIRHNPDVIVTILTDKETRAYLKKSGSKLNDIVSNFIEVDIPPQFRKVERSRFIKTKLRSFIEGDYLYLDTDTIILKPINKIFESKHDIAAVQEAHNNKRIHQWGLYLEAIKKKKLKHGNYFNSGVLYVKDKETCHKLYQDWHELWLEDVNKYNFYLDQPALSRVELLNPGIIGEMDGVYNCQIESFNSNIFLVEEKNFPILDNIYIFHYLNKKKEHFFPLKQDEFWIEFRKTGITEEVMSIIKDPLSFYYKVWFLNVLNDHRKMHALSLLGEKLGIRYPILNRLAASLTSRCKLFIDKCQRNKGSL